MSSILVLMVAGGDFALSSSTFFVSGTLLSVSFLPPYASVLPQPCGLVDLEEVCKIFDWHFVALFSLLDQHILMLSRKGITEFGTEETSAEMEMFTRGFSLGTRWIWSFNSLPCLLLEKVSNYLQCVKWKIQLFWGISLYSPTQRKH